MQDRRRSGFMRTNQFAKQNWNSNGSQKTEYSPAEFLSKINEIPSGTETELKENEDAWDVTLLPAPGDYRIALYVKDNIVLSESRSGIAYFRIPIEGHIISEESDVNGFPVYASVNTIIPHGKHISTAAGVLVM